MANEYIGDKGQDIRRILDQQVLEKDGTIELDEYYVKTLNCHYLQIAINFRPNIVTIN